jgi:hypothetical protein
MSSPQTPRHSRQSSTVDSLPESPSIRRQSHDPSTPYRNSFRDDTLDLVFSNNGEQEGGNGMGNLADELADALSDSGDDDLGDDQSLPDATKHDQLATELSLHSRATERAADNSSGLAAIPYRRAEGAFYDGSEYGSESEFDLPGVSPGLMAKIDSIESLARRGIENYGGSSDDVVKRVTESLRDIGSQSSVEASASRSGPDVLMFRDHTLLTTSL